MKKNSLFFATAFYIFSALTLFSKEPSFSLTEMLKLLESRCLDCHDNDVQKGNLNLEPFINSQKINKAHLEKIFSQVRSENMPPIEKKPLLNKEKEIILSTIKQIAGSPISPISRILTPAEIKYSLFDIFSASPEVFNPSILLEKSYDDHFHTMQDNKISSYHMNNLFHTFKQTASSYVSIQDKFSPLRISFDKFGSTKFNYENSKYVDIRRADQRGEKFNTLVFQRSDKKNSRKTFNQFPPGKYKISFDAIVINKNNTKVMTPQLKKYLSKLMPEESCNIAFYSHPERLDVFGKKQLLKLFKFTNTAKENFSFEFEINRPSQVGLNFENAPEIKLLSKYGKVSLHPKKSRDLVDYPYIQVRLSNCKIEGPYAITPSNLTIIKNKESEKDVLLSAFEKYRQLTNTIGLEAKPYFTQNLKQLSSSMKIEEAYQMALTNFLMSPDFLVLNKSQTTGEKVRFASYSLLKSPPSKNFFKHYAALQKTKDSQKFTEYLVADPNFKRFIDTFVFQWLKLKKLKNSSIDMKKFSKFYKNKLDDKFIQESSIFILNLFKENKPASEIYDTDYSFLTPELKSFYNGETINNSYSQLTEKHKLAPSRGGLLSQGAFLAATSNGIDPLPIERAVWILENIFDNELPAPPDNINVDAFQKAASSSLRDQLKVHTTQKGCAICHVKIDPIAIIMNEFGTIGEKNLPKNFKAVEFMGHQINSYQDFKYLIKTKEESVARAFLKRLIEFTQGREIKIYDEIIIDRIIANEKTTHFKLKNLLSGIVKYYYL